jgi:hypothetical protein
LYNTTSQEVKAIPKERKAMSHISKKKNTKDKPFCDLCVNSDEGMSFTTADVIQELKWVAECAKTGKNPLTRKNQTVEQYVKYRTDDLSEDEEEARGCEGCCDEEEDEPEKVEFT